MTSRPYLESFASIETQRREQREFFLLHLGRLWANCSGRAGFICSPLVKYFSKEWLLEFREQFVDLIQGLIRVLQSGITTPEIISIGRAIDKLGKCERELGDLEKQLELVESSILKSVQSLEKRRFHPREVEQQEIFRRIYWKQKQLLAWEQQLRVREDLLSEEINCNYKFPLFTTSPDDSDPPFTFEKGDVVKVTGGNYKGHLGIV